MKKMIVVLFLAITHLFANAQSGSIKRIDSLLAVSFNSQSPGIGIGIVENGKIIFKKGYGVTDINAKQAITSATNFNIASLTKQFTAMAILQLADANKLSLDDKISSYLPALNKHVADKITIKQLLTHSSGLIDHYDYAGSKNLQHAHNIDVFNAIRNIDSTYFEPGTKFRYSNTAFCLLALIIEKVSGMSYNDNMKQKIFALAGMAHTTIWKENEPIAQPATGYTFDSATQHFMKSQAEEHVFFSTEGDGGVYTSVDDYIKWFTALQGKKIFLASMVNRARKLEFEIDSAKHLGYGFGWFVNEGANPKHVYHSGDNSGFRTFSFTIPGENFLIVIFANRDDVNIEDLVQKIYLILRPGSQPFVNVEVLTS